MAEQLKSKKEIREAVRERYAEAARAADAGGAASCCGTPAAAADHRRRDPEEQLGAFGSGLYTGSERDELPDAAKLASLGCGNPTAVADLHEGEIVLDLGSGGGERRVHLGAAGGARPASAYGIDMTDEMLELARRNQREAGDRERRVPEGDDRVGPASGRLRRRDHLQLRDQPLRGQARRLPRGGAGAAPGRSVRGHRHRRRRRDGRGDPARHGAVGRLHRGCPHRGGVPERSSSAPASRRSRSARPIG